MNTTTATTGRRLSRNRLAAAGAAVAIAAGITAAAAVGAGAAHAGTMPITHPGEPTVAMTITNHTDKTEHLLGSSAGGGQWINAPRHTLAPYATETVTAAAPTGHAETVTVNYRIGATGPKAVYQIVDAPSGANTNATGTTGDQYRITSTVDTGYPTVNAGFDLW
ncbi:hypothetical protein nbrc107696_31640 [Gordonia spumicola]|uniref:Uncharacterized protein n=1 Tax=Gordonia spumicola TaxID=589161 RepID=A0A7I9VBG6_9ACTN|nr:hypothetical protein [Gordonia spumicola]GEE02718.1 hypothetical protein nbrc107696_31640 [Gordonia spumicola]